MKTHAENFKYKGKIILTSEFLSKAFIELEQKAGRKDSIIPRNKGWIVKYIERESK